MYFIRRRFLTTLSWSLGLVLLLWILVYILIIYNCNTSGRQETVFCKQALYDWGLQSTTRVAGKNQPTSASCPEELRTDTGNINPLYLMPQQNLSKSTKAADPKMNDVILDTIGKEQDNSIIFAETSISGNDGSTRKDERQRLDKDSVNSATHLEDILRAHGRNVQKITTELKQKQRIIVEYINKLGTSSRSDVENANNISDVKNTSRVSELLKDEAKSNQTKEITDKLLIKKQELERNYYILPTEIINPVMRGFPIPNEHICKETPVDLIMLILSTADDKSTRDVIRNTYATVSRDRKSIVNGINAELLVRHVFLIGNQSTVDKADKHQIDIKKLEEENEIHEDIVLIDMVDVYDNLTTKVLHGLKWVKEYCPSASYVMKIDSDVFVHVALLTQRLKYHGASTSGSVFGYIYVRPNWVSRTGKWAVTLEDYPFDAFPAYASGTSYIITGNLISGIIEKAQYLPMVPIEDAFITGIVANRLLHAQMVNWADNSYWNYLTPNPCSFVKNAKVSVSNANAYYMQTIWDALVSSGRNMKVKCF